MSSKYASLIIVILVLTTVAGATPVAYAAPMMNECEIFPADNPWNADISGAAVHPNSDAYIANINDHGGDFVHPDFGAYAGYGIPYITVSGTQPKVPVTFDYDDESDPGPYPIPPNAPIEGGVDSDGDRHVIVIDTDNCVLYETYDSHYVGGTQKAWSAGSGAIFNLDSNALRPDGWTSADAAGLPIFPGLARCDEAMSGEINHALRFTVDETQNSYIYPATHYASHNTDPNYPPMGLRLRLKAGYNISGMTGQARVIAEALKRYGMILADNGSNWYISGETNPGCWNDDELNPLKSIPGTAFEVIVSPAPAAVVLPAPTLHLPVDGASVTGSQPVLGWNTVTGAAEYEVQFGRANPPTETVATIPSTAYTQYTPADSLLQGFTYYWRVRGIDAGDNPTPWSAVRSLTIASPTNAVPARNYFTTTTPTLTWNRVTGATEYEIQVNSSRTFSEPLDFSDTVSANMLGTTTSPLANGLYYWRVRSKNGSTTGTWSAVEVFTIDSA